MDKYDETFSYSYSAQQQEEVKRIREKYAPPTQAEDRMEQLRRLDRSVTRPGVIAALVAGVISALVLGVGMCCAMVWGEILFVPGIVIGVIGIAGVCAAYPLYARITQKRREKAAPEILRLSEELMQ